jgi:hypothetical protein
MEADTDGAPVGRVLAGDATWGWCRHAACRSGGQALQAMTPDPRRAHPRRAAPLHEWRSQSRVVSKPLLASYLCLLLMPAAMIETLPVLPAGARSRSTGPYPRASRRLAMQREAPAKTRGSRDATRGGEGRTNLPVVLLTETRRVESAGRVRLSPEGGSVANQFSEPDDGLPAGTRLWRTVGTAAPGYRLRRRIANDFDRGQGAD